MTQASRFPLAPSDTDLDTRARCLLEGLTLREKIGQKLLVAFRYWCPDDQPACTLSTTRFNSAMGDALRNNAIGGVILFGNNLSSLEQGRTLLDDLRAVPPVAGELGLLLGVDEEGGAVFRLPRRAATVFPGNMALAAAWHGGGDERMAYDQGVVLAAEIAALGFNLDFAPVVDVNSNPFNPVINVRAFGDDVRTVSLLARRMMQGMAAQGVIAAYKHFPGHGDTETDSHIGLPVVNKSREDAWAIDLAPYRLAIEAGEAPEMVMTAHIQYPALDSTLVQTRTGEPIIAPATMSRKIQHNILRGELGFQGVSITDAMDMKAIAGFFGQADAVIKAFQADVDIALMPIEFRTARQAGLLSGLVDQVVAAVEAGDIDRQELDQSVLRIVRMKLRNGITAEQGARPRPELNIIGSPAHRALEQRITAQSITLIRNQCAALPLKNQCARILILTPRNEQAEALRRRFEEAGYPALLLTGKALRGVGWVEIKRAINAAETVILGTSSIGVSAVVRNAHADQLLSGATVQSSLQWLRCAMEYATSRGKLAIHLTMNSPYDVVEFDDIAGATLATYSSRGYDRGLLGPALPAAVDVMLGRSVPVGRLPVDIFALADGSQPGALRYPRGTGLGYP